MKDSPPSIEDTLHRSRLHIAGMDCPSEEQLIRRALAEAETVEHLEFDVPARSMAIWHRGEVDELLARVESLELGARLESTEQVARETLPAQDGRGQARVLRWVLSINAAMFAVEFVAGCLAESTGLLADSLDMLADAAVYALALWAVARNTSSQRTAARLSGWLQLLLAVGVLGEVARRALTGSAPEAPLIMGTAAVALLANVVCLLALARHRSGGQHMQASWIFTTNDVIANIGVIGAGALVRWTGSAVPDLIIGTVIGFVVLRGAVRILKLSKAA